MEFIVIAAVLAVVAIVLVHRLAGKRDDATMERYYEGPRGLSWIARMLRWRKARRRDKEAARRIDQAMEAPQDVSVEDFYAICRDTNLDQDHESRAGHRHYWATREFRTKAAQAMLNGHEAADRGVPLDQNPYAPGTAFHDRWKRGWCAMKGVNPKTGESAEEWRRKEEEARRARREANRKIQEGRK